MSDDQQKGAAHWTDDNFEANIKKAAEAGTPVMVDFYADWCGPCKMAARIIDKLAEEFAGKVQIVKVDVDENNATAGKHQVMSIPTVIMFDAKGAEAQKQVGFPGEQGYRNMIDGVLN